MARMTLNVPNSVRERLDRLKDKAEATSITEVIRRALATYELLLDEHRVGGEIVFERDGERRKLALP